MLDPLLLFPVRTTDQVFTVIINPAFLEELIALLMKRLKPTESALIDLDARIDIVTAQALAHQGNSTDLELHINACIFCRGLDFINPAPIGLPCGYG